MVLDSAFVERLEPESVHVEERMEADDDFIAFGTEIWDYELAEGREDEFEFALVNSGVVLESEAIENDLRRSATRLTDCQGWAT